MTRARNNHLDVRKDSYPARVLRNPRNFAQICPDGEEFRRIHTCGSRQPEDLAQSQQHYPVLDSHLFLPRAPAAGRPRSPNTLSVLLMHIISSTMSTPNLPCIRFSAALSSLKDGGCVFVTLRADVDPDGSEAFVCIVYLEHDSYYNADGFRPLCLHGSWFRWLHF